MNPSILLLALSILALGLPIWTFPGGSSSNMIDWLWWVMAIILPVIMIHKTFKSFIQNQKKKECTKLLAKIGKSGIYWSSDLLQARIETAFFQVQKAWAERNQDLAREYMSRALYDKRQEQTDTMIEAGHKKIISDITLETTDIVQISDCRDDSQNSFVAYLSGEMTEDSIDEKTNALIKKHDKPITFEELWRRGGPTLLDRFATKLSYNSLVNVMPLA